MGKILQGPQNDYDRKEFSVDVEFFAPNPNSDDQVLIQAQGIGSIVWLWWDSSENRYVTTIDGALDGTTTNSRIIAKSKLFAVAAVALVNEVERQLAKEQERIPLTATFGAFA